MVEIKSLWQESPLTFYSRREVSGEILHGNPNAYFQNISFWESIFSCGKLKTYGASWQLRIKSSLPSSSGTSQFVESTWFRIDKRSLSSFGLAHSGFSSSSFPGQSFFPSHLKFHLYIHPQCVSRTALIKKWEISTIYYKMYKIYQRQMERHSSVPLQLTPFTHISTSPENHI